jgi:hypothetical protein
MIEIAIGLITRFEPHSLQHSQKTGQADRDGWKDNMEGNSKCELDPGEMKGI